MKCFFPEEISILVDLKQNKFQWFQKVTTKKKKWPSVHFHTFSPSNFKFSSFFFTIFRLFFFILLLSLPLFSRLAKISRWKMSGGTLFPIPLPVTPLALSWRCLTVPGQNHLSVIVWFKCKRFPKKQVVSSTKTEMVRPNHVCLFVFFPQYKPRAPVASWFNAASGTFDG